MLEKIELEKIVAIAKEAGEAIMQIYTKDFTIEYKDDKSPLTEADLKANDIICTTLQKLYPHIPVMSEENKQVEYKVRKKWEYYWCIDPIDGTKEFIKKNDEFTVNIALIHKNTPVIGVVYAPAIGEMYKAKKKEGAFKNNQKLPLHVNKIPKEKLVVVASKSHLSDETQEFIDHLDTKEIEQVSKGSSLKLCMVAEGVADIYPRLAPTMEWDTAAADVIVRESGKLVYQYENNKPIVYNKENLLNPWFVVEKVRLDAKCITNSIKNNIFTLGAPRTGFTLLVSIINELLAHELFIGVDKQLKLNTIIDMASIYLKNEFINFFEDKIDMKDYMYNGEFDLLVGGPKWINPNNPDECVVRKYIGIKDNGDFTFLIYLPKSVLNYDRVVHSHYYPQSWIKDNYYDKYTKLSSIRNPMGVINSAVFSINAITSEYITKYIKDFNEDEFREVMAQYKLTDLDLFDGLVRFLKDYLDEFIPVMNEFNIIKWENIVDKPFETIEIISKIIGVEIHYEDIKKLWNKLDHKNLPKHHLYNFRKGHGIVGEWKKRLTNHHLKIFEKYDFNKYLKLFGYEEIKYFDESKYTKFQREINKYIVNGKICNKITDNNLFKFCWNKSNIALTQHKFDRFHREGFSQIERSSLKDSKIATDFLHYIQPKIELINTMIKEAQSNKDFSFIVQKYFSLFEKKLNKKSLIELKKQTDKIENMKKLELKLIKTEKFEEVLDNFKHFNIVSNNQHAKELKFTFKNKLDKSSPNIIITDEDPTEILQTYINKHSGVIVAKIGKRYYQKKSLFLISIPKAGTHLLFELVKAFGYKEGGVCPSRPKGGHWYYTEYSNSHTNVKHFFNDTVYQSDFGNRDHPFTFNPAIFMYRNPLDIVSSEANYYHKSSNTSFVGYFSGLTYDQRLTKLINDKWLLGSIRDRISNFIAWNYFENVISISFEELIGERGGGGETIQKQLIWSMQLKLQVPGKPLDFAKQIFNTNSSTFFKGQIGGHKELFKKEHYMIFEGLDQDFMNELGYSLQDYSLYSSHITKNRSKKLTYKDDILFPPILKIKDYFKYNIVKYKNQFYAILQNLGAIDLQTDALDKSILISDDLELLKLKILKRSNIDD